MSRARARWGVSGAWAQWIWVAEEEAGGGWALPSARPSLGALEGHGGVPRGYSRGSQGLRVQARLALPSHLPMVR